LPNYSGISGRLFDSPPFVTYVFYGRIDFSGAAQIRARCRRTIPMRARATQTRSAAATVEFAVLLPFIALCFVVAVDYARIFYYSQIIENCARQGALYACDPKAPANYLYTSTSQAALADASNLSPQPTVSSTSGTDASNNKYVAVTVTWTFNTISQFPGVPTSVTLTRTVQMRSAP
jgi:Flp pilus assembly protein TadG